MKKLKEIYNEEIVPALMKEMDYKNKHQVPKIEKVVINVGLGEGAQNSKIMEIGVNELTSITGQKAVVTRAKKSIAAFKLREGMPVGARVTLRGNRMYNFVMKLVGIAIPRIRDFRGISDKAFDGHGNYNIGLKDQLVFPEIDYDKVERLRGMNITIVTSATNDIDAKALLVAFGFPFKKKKEQKNQAAAS